MTTLPKLVSIAFTAFVLSAPALAADVSVGDAAAGKVVYDGKGACGSCHGATGAGDGVAAAALDPKPSNFAKGEFRLDTDGDGTPGSATDLANSIKNGAGQYGGNVAMPGRPDLSETEIHDLVAFIRTLKL